MAIMHAPQERIMLEDHPLHAFEGRNSRTERTSHGGQGRALLRCLNCPLPWWLAASSRPTAHA